MGALVTHTLSPETLDSWGWRVPFILDLLIGPVGLWMRRHMEEPQAFLDAQQAHQGKASLRQVLGEHRRALLATMGTVANSTVAFYVVLVNMPSFANKQLGLPLDQVFMVQMLAVALMTVVIPLAGALSDRVGRRPVLFIGTLALFLLVYPLFTWVAQAPSVERLLVMQLVLCSLIGMFFGPAPTTLAEQFPTRMRSTGLALSYNVAVMLFGGFAPFIVTWLTQVDGSPVAAAYYVLFATLIGLTATCFLREGAPAALERRQRRILMTTTRSCE